MVRDMLDAPTERPPEGTRSTDGRKATGRALNAVRCAGRWWAVWVFVAAAIVVTVNPPFANSPVIRSDGLGYHAWTRAVLDGDFSFCDYDQLLRDQSAYGPIPGTGRCASKYTPGVAIVRMPVMIWFTAANGGRLRSPAEDRVAQWCAVAAGMLTIAAAIAVSRRLGASTLCANLSALAIGFGTGLFHYATYDASFSHVYSAAFVGLLLYSGAVYVARTNVGTGRGWPVAGVATATGFIVLIRQTNLLVVGGIALTWLVVWMRGRLTVAQLREHVPLFAATAGTIATALAFGLSYNRWAYGAFRLSSYGRDEVFSITEGRQDDVLWSWNRGLIVWFPILLVLVVMLVTGRRWNPLLLVGATTAPLVLLYGAWRGWNLAGGFGHRGFVELAPVYAVALSCGFGNRSRVARIIGIAAATLSVVATLGLLRAYWADDIPFYGIDSGEWAQYAVGADNVVVETVRWVQHGMR